MNFSPADREALAAAMRRLESPSLAGRVASLAGKPVGFVQRALPAAASTAVANVAKHALERALDVALDKGAVREGAPFLVRFLTQIASRFGVVVSQKIAAQAVAVVGAVGGAAVNLAFIEHFQDVARGHFTVRRLERVYGAEIVRAEYDRLKMAFAAAA